MKMTFITKKHLGLSKFLKELSLVAEYFKWEEPGQPAIRECCYIRGYQNGMRFCPLTAVAHAVKGVNFSMDRWLDAAEAMNIPEDLALLILKAADGGAISDSESVDLHERLLKTIGL